MALLAYDPQRLRRLRAEVAGAADQLARMGCGDPTALVASGAVARARSTLADLWVPRIDRVLASTALTWYPAMAFGGFSSPFVATSDALSAVVPQAGALAVEIPHGASLCAFPIPVWIGRGVTRIQFFLDADRPAALGAAMSDYRLRCRLRIVLDHESGVAVVVSYPSPADGDPARALPVQLVVDGSASRRGDQRNAVRLWTRGDGVSGNIVFDYRFVDSLTGAIRVQRTLYTDEVVVDGRLGRYPSVEIIRDHPLPNGFHSAQILVKPQESGGADDPDEPGEQFTARG